MRMQEALKALADGDVVDTRTPPGRNNNPPTTGDGSSAGTITRPSSERLVSLG